MAATPVFRLGVMRLLGRLGGQGWVAAPALTCQTLKIPIQPQQPHGQLHSSAIVAKSDPMSGPHRWFTYNNRRYPPTPIGEKERHAFVCHVKKNIKYSPDKMWYVACLVRGLRIDEAIAQLRFVHKKGASFAIETLEEARKLAVEEHFVEYPSNLWVSESFVGKGIVYRGFRRHARRRFGKVEYKHCHYFVTLEEGEPPEHYYPHRRPLTPEEHVEEYIENLRKRNIPKAL